MSAYYENIYIKSKNNFIAESRWSGNLNVIFSIKSLGKNKKPSSRQGIGLDLVDLGYIN